MTGYFINVPVNKLELWMWMESDPVLRPVFREFYASAMWCSRNAGCARNPRRSGSLPRRLTPVFWESHPLQLAHGRLAVGYSPFQQGAGG